MKTAVFLAFVAAALVNDCAGESIEKVALKFGVLEKQVVDCMGEAGVTDEVLTLLDLSAQSIQEQKKINCMTACILEKKGSMTGNRINIEKFHEVVNKAKNISEETKQEYRNLMDKCNDSVKNIEDKCQVIKEYVHCMVAKSRST